MSRPVQPYYAAYCVAEGRDPDAQLAHDKARFPGGCMAGFINWIMSQWSDFGREFGVPEHQRGMYRAEFQAWLEVRVNAPRQGQLFTEAA